MEHKTFKTIDEQIQILDSRGLSIPDKEYATNILLNSNYYRLSGYSLTLRKGDTFVKGSEFNDIVEIYDFDRRLRSLLFSYLETIEVELRTHIAYEVGKADIDPNETISYLKAETFATDKHFLDFMDELAEAHKDSKNEAFVKHHDTKYGGVLPVWAVVETLSFGALSRMYSSLNTDLKKRISQNYYHGLKGNILDNWFQGLVVLRNLCAHRARLFNRGFIMSPLFSTEEVNYFASQGYNGDQIGKRLFFRLIVIAKLSQKPVEMMNQMISDIDDMIAHSPINLKYYGFQKNWDEIMEHVIK